MPPGGPLFSFTAASEFMLAETPTFRFIDSLFEVPATDANFLKKLLLPVG